MAISRHDVEQVALLARLRLSPDELDRLTDEMDQIVAYFHLLDQVETDDIEPMAHAVEVHNVFAADELRPGLTRDEALANAPKRDDECYRVPAVLGD